MDVTGEGRTASRPLSLLQSHLRCCDRNRLCLKDKSRLQNSLQRTVGLRVVGGSSLKEWASALERLEGTLMVHGCGVLVVLLHEVDLLPLAP